MVASHPLHSAYDQYQTLVDQLANSPTWEPEPVLTMLRTRDRIQHLIDQLGEIPEAQTLPPQFWLSLANTDAILGRHTDQLRAVPALVDWRKSVHPPEHHWWWYPPELEPPKDALAWLWGGLTIAMLTISLALAQDIASRFTLDTPGVWSSLGAIAPVILTLFASGGALTKVGQQLLESVLASRSSAAKNWARIKFALAFALALGLFLFHSLVLPRIAVAYNQAGEEQYESGDWASAQDNFEQALSIRPDYPAAQFNLGVLYEAYQQLDQAQTEYLKAVQGGYLPAYNNLAHLYIQQGNPEDAVPLLRSALGNPVLSQQAPELQYLLHKNLGQARLEQERFAEAQTALLEAIVVGQSLTNPRPDAFCLLAQALGQSSAPADSSLPAANTAWRSCLQYATRPEDDIWESQARQALTQPENLYAPEPAP
ncbi:tetratricopeptide repeat protein [Nodosilinea sp. LEGE 07088]|uniref:tetratricopeptide repeat protein n=1 Tax=Nodosilinea sp. LEGE 07088 TaxID=2777968 RepID=UPI001881AA88|nr:tetratricopeptide repeat protein [Nodosilinea sp. LEGE 07088]MBE9137392.1 tetratricopeptide repeat protein [Nodosilinea sp. LEGE 07088]